jgi:hypothetical protein
MQRCTSSPTSAPKGSAARMDLSALLAESCGLTLTCPHFSVGIDGDVFEWVDVDEDLIQGEVEGRFVRLFQESWRAEH